MAKPTNSPVPGVSGTRLSGPTCSTWNAVLTSWQLYASASITFIRIATNVTIQTALREFKRELPPRDIAASHSGYPWRRWPTGTWLSAAGGFGNQEAREDQRRALWTSDETFPTDFTLLVRMGARGSLTEEVWGLCARASLSRALCRHAYFKVLLRPPPPSPRCLPQLNAFTESHYNPFNGAPCVWVIPQLKLFVP